MAKFDRTLWIHGLLVIGQNEYPFAARNDEELLNYIKSGKKIKVVELMEIEIEEAKENE